MVDKPVVDSARELLALGEAIEARERAMQALLAAAQ
jgi:hypothetical protein